MIVFGRMRFAHRATHEPDPQAVPALRVGIAFAVRDAISRIGPLPGDGPNRWTVDVAGWGISAPTKRRLCLMLWQWFQPDEEAA